MITSRVGFLVKNVSFRSFHTSRYLRNRENPIARTFRILKDDVKQVTGAFQSKTEPGPTNEIFPSHCDVAIIGGGAMGSSIAYWLKERTRKGLNVVVVEKDPTYSQASTVLSVGGLRQQFSLPENIQMSLFGAEFLRNIKKYLGNDSDVFFTPHGYLLLASERGAEQIQKNCEIQKSFGARNILLGKEKLKERFPWLNVDGVEFGCYGLENEGWFDPWALLHFFKKRSIELGAEYIHGEVKEFEFTSDVDIHMQGVNEPYSGMDKLVVKLPNGDTKTIKFGCCIIAAGAKSGHIGKLARIGSGNGILSVPLPVEPRKRYVYCFDCEKDGPGLNTPLTIDHTGTYFRREGLGGSYIGGRAPTPEEEPNIDNLDVDHSFFDSNVWPVLANRVPAFNAIKVRSAWSGYYEFNTFDENGIIGPHPYYHNLYIATGFSGHGIQQSPAVGRAISEMILDGAFSTIDLTRLGFDRILLDTPIREQNCF